MAILDDIYDDLETIKNDPLGKNVLQSIFDALVIIYSDGGYDTMVNIWQELNIIGTGIHGKDIRMAIHDALYKLASAEPDTKTEDTAVVAGPLNIPRMLVESHAAEITWVEEYTSD